MIYSNIYLNGLDIDLYDLFMTLAVVIALSYLYIRLSLFSKISQILFAIVLFFCFYGILLSANITGIIFKSEQWSIYNIFIGNSRSFIGVAFILPIIIYLLYITTNCGLAYISDTIMLVFWFSYSIAKIGCYFDGCCKGIHYNGILSIGGRFPAQLFEICQYAIFFIFLYFVKRSKHYYNGLLFLISISLILLVLATRDFYREYSTSLIINEFTYTQIIAFVLLIISIPLSLYFYYKRKKMTS